MCFLVDISISVVVVSNVVVVAGKVVVVSKLFDSSCGDKRRPWKKVPQASKRVEWS